MLGFTGGQVKKKLACPGVVDVALGAQLSDEFVCERMAKKSNFFKVEILMSCSVGLVVPI